MNTENRKFKLIAALVTLLMVSAIAFLAVKMQANGRLKDELNAQKLRSESMLSEKLSLEKDILKLRSDIKSLEGTNHDLDKELVAIAQKLEAREEVFKKLQKQNTSLEQLRKQHQELRSLKDELERQLAYYIRSVKELKTTNEELNQTIAALQQRNSTLAEELNMAKMAAFNDARVESLKKNNKLTINASKTRKLMVYAGVPVTAEDLTFTITGPSGKELTDKDGTITSRVVNNYRDGAYTASLNEVYTEPKAYKEVEMTFTPVHKLAPGVYRIVIKNNNMSIGSLQVRYR